MEAIKEMKAMKMPECDVIGNFPYKSDECKGCGQTLTIENAWMTDGCPCNSPLGINNDNETRWRLLMQLQQRQTHELAALRRRVGELEGDAAKWRRIEPELMDFYKRIGTVEVPPSLRSLIESIHALVSGDESRTVRISCEQAGDYWYARFHELGCIGHGDTIFEALRHLTQVAADYHYAYEKIPESSLCGTVLSRRNASKKFFDEWVNHQPTPQEGT